MTDLTLLTVVLLFAHILSAILWLGGGVVIGFLVVPRLRSLSPAAASEFIVTIFPRVLRFFQVVAGTTILFGVLLLVDLVNPDYGRISPSTSWGLAITLGMTFAIAAFVVSEALAVPAFQRVVRLNEAMRSSGNSTPPPELPNAAQRAGMMALVATLLLLVTVGFMAAAGVY